MKTLALISCVKAKRTSACAAEDLYCSDWFRKARTYVEKQGWSWKILSTKYGLLEREQIIEPYELTLRDLSLPDKRLWASKVYDQILQVTDGGEEILFFAGGDYRKYLIPLLETAGFSIKVPLAGLGIGQQLAWFKNQL